MENPKAVSGIILYHKKTELEQLFRFPVYLRTFYAINDQHTYYLNIFSFTYCTYVQYIVQCRTDTRVSLIPSASSRLCNGSYPARAFQICSSTALPGRLKRLENSSSKLFYPDIVLSIQLLSRSITEKTWQEKPSDRFWRRE